MGQQQVSPTATSFQFLSYDSDHQVFCNDVCIEILQFIGNGNFMLNTCSIISKQFYNLIKEYGKLHLVFRNPINLKILEKCQYLNRIVSFKYVLKWDGNKSDNVKLCKILKQMPQLREVWMFEQLYGSKGLKILSEMNQLTILDVSNNKISDIGMECISQMSQLTDLRMRDGVLGYDTVPLPEMKQLTKLDISNNRFSSYVTEFIQNLQSLTCLNVYGNRLDTKEMHSISRMLNLTELNIGDNHIGPEGVKLIGNMTQLTRLSIPNNRIANGVQFLKNLNRLTDLNISANKIGDIGVLKISEMTQLITLTIRQNRISDQGAKTLGLLHNLTYLDIAENVINEDTAKSMENYMKSLKYKIIF